MPKASTFPKYYTEHKEELDKEAMTTSSKDMMKKYQIGAYIYRSYFKGVYVKVSKAMDLEKKQASLALSSMRGINKAKVKELTNRAEYQLRLKSASEKFGLTIPELMLFTNDFTMTEIENGECFNWKMYIKNKIIMALPTSYLESMVNFSCGMA